MPPVAAPAHAVPVEPAAPAIKAEALVGTVGHPTGYIGRLGHHGRSNRLDDSAAIGSTLDDLAAPPRSFSWALSFDCHTQDLGRAPAQS